MEAMFNSIASRYDFLNHFLSLGIDRLWRQRMVRMIAKGSPKKVLDIATGTADLSICLAKRSKNSSIAGVDISANMLEIGKKKVDKKRLSHQIELQKGSAMALPFPNSSFNCVMVAFGARNFEDLSKGFSEANRVLKNGGSFFVLEFSMPTNRIVRGLYGFYFNRVLPFLGAKVSGNSNAYRYLPSSVGQFPYGEQFAKALKEANFEECWFIPLWFGIATIYVGTKRTLLP